MMTRKILVLAAPAALGVALAVGLAGCSSAGDEGAVVGGPGTIVPRATDMSSAPVDPASQTPSSTPAPSSPVTLAPPRAIATPGPGPADPDSAATAAPITNATIQTPTILTPTEGRALRGTPLTVTISGTGSPGTNVFLTIGCVATAPACTISESLGQPWQTPIRVDASGHWSAVDKTDPDAVIHETITATAALIDASGATRRDAAGALIQSGPSGVRNLTVGPAN